MQLTLYVHSRGYDISTLVGDGDEAVVPRGWELLSAGPREGSVGIQELFSEHSVPAGSQLVALSADRLEGWDVVTHSAKPCDTSSAAMFISYKSHTFSLKYLCL